MGAWIVVHTKPPVLLGSYAPRHEPYVFDLPPDDVPNGPGSFATCGPYRAVITLHAAEFATPVHERVLHIEIR